MNQETREGTKIEVRWKVLSNEIHQVITTVKQTCQDEHFSLIVDYIDKINWEKIITKRKKVKLAIDDKKTLIIEIRRSHGKFDGLCFFEVTSIKKEIIWGLVMPIMPQYKRNLVEKHGELIDILFSPFDN